jgi:acetyl esterase
MDTAPLDPGMLAFYRELAARTPPGSEHWPLPKQREEWDALCRVFRAPRPPGIIVEDVESGGVRARVFRPAGNGMRPGVIYGHGGGWVLGSPETHDDMCAEIAAEADCAVVLIDYRLAPEHPFPAQLEDSLMTLAWMRRQDFIDPSRIVGAGDSAGGQMTAALALHLRDHGVPQIQGQVLIYPVLGADMETASYIRNADAPCLTRAEMRYYLDAFLGRSNWTNPYAVPNLADVAGLPPAFVAVAAHDPLHDDGVIFHEKLRSAGVRSTLRREPALAHSYMRARHRSPPAMAGFKAIVAAARSLAHEGRLPD